MDNGYCAVPGEYGGFSFDRVDGWRESSLNNALGSRARADRTKKTKNTSRRAKASNGSSSGYVTCDGDMDHAPGCLNVCRNSSDARCQHFCGLFVLRLLQTKILCRGRMRGECLFICRSQMGFDGEPHLGNRYDW